MNVQNAKRGLLAGLSRRASIIRTMKNNKTVTAGISEILPCLLCVSLFVPFTLTIM